LLFIIIHPHEHGIDQQPRYNLGSCSS